MVRNPASLRTEINRVPGREIIGPSVKEEDYIPVAGAVVPVGNIKQAGPNFRRLVRPRPQTSKQSHLLWNQPNRSANGFFPGWQ
jgi:hypothetical protein